MAMDENLVFGLKKSRSKSKKRRTASLLSMSCRFLEALLILITLR